jgi:hypothetical protein
MGTGSHEENASKQNPEPVPDESEPGSNFIALYPDASSSVTPVLASSAGEQT